MNDDQQRDGGGSGADGTREGDGGRLRLVDVRTEHRPDSGVRIVVELSDGGVRHRGEVEGVGTGAVELRLAGAAALEAIRQAVPEAAEMRIVGMKKVRAFDADVVLAGLRSHRESDGRLVGAVPSSGDSDRAAAAAVLDAVNRVLDAPG